eukprot:6325249-Prymnesium_polylepis.1
MKVGEAVASQNVFYVQYILIQQASDTTATRPGCMRATLGPRTPSDAHIPQRTSNIRSFCRSAFSAAAT